LGKYQPNSFKTERLVCVETDGQADMARSTRLVMLIKNMYTLWGRIARPSWLVVWHFGTRGSGQLLFGDIAVNRRALQDNASWNHISINRSSFEPGPAWLGKVRRVLDNFPPKLTVPRRRSLSLDSDKPAARFVRVWSWQSWKSNALWCLPDLSHLCLNSEISDVPIANVST